MTPYITGKNDAAESEAAVKAFLALAQGAMVVSEPYLLAALPVLLRAAAHKASPVRNAANETVAYITSHMTLNSVREVLQYLFSAAKIEENWQTRALALRTIATFGDFASYQLGVALPQVSFFEYFSYLPFLLFIFLCAAPFLFLLMSSVGCSRGHHQHDRDQEGSEFWCSCRHVCRL